MSSRDRRLVFVQPFCPHYRVRTFELLAERFDIDFLFFSRGGEGYWIHDLAAGRFKHETITGPRILGTVVSPALVRRLLTDRYDAYVAQINGRFAVAATWAAARRAGRPFVLWTGLWRHPRSPGHLLGYPLVRALYRSADAVVTYGGHVDRYLESKGVAPERLFALPHAVDPPAADSRARAAQRAALGLDADATLVLYLGRLVPEKGVAFLVEAMRDVPASLAVVGAGREESSLRQQAARLGLSERVRFRGYVRPDAVGAWYAAADILVLPSVTTATFREPWGLVVNEAFHHGVPVVATDTVGAAAGGLVVNGVTGRVVPERDPAALAAALCELVGNPARRRRMGAAARMQVTAWSQERMAAAFARALETVL